MTSVHTTHEVFNQPSPLENYNVFLADNALQEAVEREGAAWAVPELTAYGQVCGRADTILLGFQANEHRPRLRTHDGIGRRIDFVEYHPAYHQLMTMAISHGLHCQPWVDPKPGAHVARAAYEYLQTQVEAGHGCPITMSFAATPTLRKQDNVAARWWPLLMSTEYDGRNLPISEKRGITLGMGMTEKQGGSDVRANTTRAQPIGGGGPGELYALTGHKYFVSAPMSDGFLVLAQAPGGLSCFLLPRWTENGDKNAMEIQQLKNKMGNVSNASSEVELRGAQAWLIGEEGRGVANIIEMVALTRFDCMVASAAGMRQAVAQITHHAAHRHVFGKALQQQPLMQNVLADLILESEAALALSMRTARTLDNLDQEHDAALFRLLAPIGKYWNCKRTAAHAYEAMECIGGRGAIEDSILPRLYREAPINAIWEGSGNIQCLDVFRAINKQPESLQAFLTELDAAKGLHTDYDNHLTALKKQFDVLKDLDNSDIEYGGRALVENMALAIQASLLLRAGNMLVAEAFCTSRCGNGLTGLFGTLPAGIDCQAIINRARPQ